MMEREHQFTGEEYADFNWIVQRTLNSLIVCADKHNLDRDTFVQYFGAVFKTMAEISTFKNYKAKGE